MVVSVFMGPALPSWILFVHLHTSPGAGGSADQGAWLAFKAASRDLVPPLRKLARDGDVREPRALGMVATPAVSRVALDAGSHRARWWQDFSAEDVVHTRTTGASVTTSVGLELGVFVAKRGYRDGECFFPPDDDDPSVGQGGQGGLALSSVALLVGGGAAATEPCPDDTVIRRFYRHVDYRDVKLLWRTTFLETGWAAMHFAAGGLIGSARGCHEEALDEWPVDTCAGVEADYIGAWVLGAGADVRLSDHIDITLGLQFGSELDRTKTPPDFTSLGRVGYPSMNSLLAGVAYRRQE